MAVAQCPPPAPIKYALGVKEKECLSITTSIILYNTRKGRRRQQTRSAVARHLYTTLISKVDALRHLPAGPPHCPFSDMPATWPSGTARR